MMPKLLLPLQSTLLNLFFLNFLLPNTLICVSPYVVNSLYDSLSRMEELLKSQVKIRHALETKRFIIAKDRQHTKIFDNFIARCLREEEIAANIGAERYLHNPINSFSLITRLSKDLSFVEELLDGTSYQRPLGEYPSVKDLDGAVEEFTRLQLLYDLDPFLLANGTLVNPYNNETRAVIEQVSPMTPDDCYELSLVQYNKEDRNRNIAWLSAALKMLRTPKDEMVITKAELLSRLAGEYYESGNFHNTIVNLEAAMAAAPYRPENKEIRKVVQLLKVQIKEKVKCKQPVYDFKLPKELKKPLTERKLQDYNYPGLCVKKPRNYINPKLSCHFAYGPHAFLKLAPTRTEVLSHSPFVVIYHDFISDNEIRELKRLSRSRLLSAPSLSVEGQKSEEIKYYNYQLAWVSDTASPIVEGITRKISRATGLNVRNFSEQFQVANYGLGGYYGPHYDFIQSNFSKTVGKTYATMLLYLTDVLEGGATIFLSLNITVFPRKNSALFWLSLDEAGADDFRTQHAACQTLHGNRWVASKWITFVGQELIRPCPATMKFKKRPKRKIKSRRKIRF